MDIGKSLSFVFEDKTWIEKVLIGALITLGTILLSWTVIGAIVGAALLYGYMIELVRNVRRGEATPLPEWDNWGEKIVLGIKYGIVLIIWSLPAIVVAVPLGILSGIFSNTDAQGFFGVLWTCFSCLVALYTILLLVATPAITLRFAERGDITDSLAFSEILRFTRQHIGDVIIIVIVLLVVQFIAGIVGAILCGIGILATSFWAILVQGHLYGQLGREKSMALAPSGGSPFDLRPDDVMPGVGEITSGVQDSVSKAQDAGSSAVQGVQEVMEDVKSGAEEAVAKAEDLGSSVVEATSDVLPEIDKPDA